MNCPMCSQLLSALKLVFVVPRPWIDGASGLPGTVTFAEWDAAMSTIDAAIAKAERQEFQ